jgi:Spy/CpxP family protein refolding chaperone
MTRTLNAVLLTTALLTGLSTAALAEAPANPGMHHAMKNTLMSIPNLTPEQRQKTTDLLNTAKTQTAPVRDQIVAARKEMATLWAADTLDKPAIAAKQGEIEGSLGKIKTIWADFFVQLHDVLTSSQRAWVTLHGPGMHEGGDFGMGANCQCNQAPEK